MGIIKYATSDVIDFHPGPKHWARTAHRADFSYKVRPGFVYVRSRAVSSRTNDNFDTFEADELRLGWKTFLGRPSFVNHHNEDIRQFRGVIIDAALHEDQSPDGSDDVWVETLMEIDGRRYPRLATEILEGRIGRTSMGVNVRASQCSACGNLAETVDKYCAHMASSKGSRVPRYNAATGTTESVLVHEFLKGLNFFENSILVEDPADPTAYLYGVDGTGLHMAMSTTAATSVPRRINLLHADGCPVCGANDWDESGQCGVCGYEIPPEPFENPDLDAASRVPRDGTWFSPSLVKAPPFQP